MIGSMEMPADFKYRDIYLHGRPRHQKYDAFWRKHPPMPVSKRAKIFAPFDALAGFNQCIENKRVLYTTKKDLSDSEKAGLNSCLTELAACIRNGRARTRNRPAATIEYFCPCRDENSEWYGKGGTYETISGEIMRIDGEISRTIRIRSDSEEMVLRFEDISGIQPYFHINM